MSSDTKVRKEKNPHDFFLAFLGGVFLKGEGLEVSMNERWNFFLWEIMAFGFFGRVGYYFFFTFFSLEERLGICYVVCIGKKGGEGWRSY